MKFIKKVKDYSKLLRRETIKANKHNQDIINELTRAGIECRLNAQGDIWAYYNLRDGQTLARYERILDQFNIRSYSQVGIQARAGYNGFKNSVFLSRAY